MSADQPLAEKRTIRDLPITIYPPTATKPYHQVVYTVDGKRHVLSGGRTEATAMAKAERIAAMIAADATKAMQPADRMINAWLDPRRPRDKPWSIKYADGNTRLAALYVRPVIGTTPCQDLTRELIQRVVDKAPTQGEGARVKRLLSACLRWAYPHRYLVVAPAMLLGDVHWRVAPVAEGEEEAEPLEPPPTTEGQDELFVTPDKVPSHDRVAELMEATAGLEGAKYWWRLMPAVAAYSGVRLGELLALTAADVDTKHRQINVLRQRIDNRGGRITAPKRRKTRTTIYPKRTPDTRTYPGGFDLAAAFARRVREVRQVDPGGLLFPAPRGGYWAQTNFDRRRFHPAARAAGWPFDPVLKADGTPELSVAGEPMESVRWTWHDFRHVFCTHYLWDLHASPADVSTAAGHANVQITLRLYASDVAGAMKRLRAL